MLFIKILCCKQAAIILKLKLKLFNLLNNMQKKQCKAWYTWEVKSKWSDSPLWI